MPNRSLQERDLSRPVTEFINPAETVLDARLTVSQALKTLRQRDVKHKIVYFYIVEGEGRLIGVVPTRRFLLSGGGTPLRELMDSPAVAIPSSATLWEALEMFSSHRLLALPVVDPEGRLLGTVDVQLYAQEALDLAELREARELFQLLGVSVEQLRRRSAWGAFRLRMPWLLCTLAGGIACAVIAYLFREVLAGVVLLAMFLPLVLALSESVSMQSVTLSLRLLRGAGAAGWPVSLRQTALEWRTALLLGMASAACVGLVASFWGQGLVPAGVIALSILASVLCGATVGLVLPACLHAMKLDPHVAAGPVVLMLSDIVTTGVYLGLGTWWLL